MIAAAAQYSDPLPPVIILGVDTAIGLTVIRELGRHGVPVIAIGRSAHAIGRASRYTTRFFQRPKEQQLGAWLPRLIAETRAAALFAVSEGDLLELADMPDQMGDCRILTPRRAPLETVLDKTRTLEIARSVGIDTPESWQPLAGEDFATRAKLLRYPVVLKWADPLSIMARLEAAGLAFEKADHAPDAGTLLGLLDKYHALGAYPLVQSWCAGHGLGQMLLMVDGAARLRFQHQRLREYPATGGVSTLCASVPLDRHAAQMEKSEALLRAIGWEGPAMVEYRHDPIAGTYWLMEINGRFWGSLPLASQSGAEFAWEHYRAAVLRAPAAEDRPIRARRARYMIPDTRRLAEIWRGQARAGRGRLRETLAWLGEFLSPVTGYYVWSWRDPRPLLSDVATILTRRGR